MNHIRLNKQTSRIFHQKGETPKKINRYLATLLTRFRAWNQKRKVDNMLRNLDDKCLKDIGADRNKLGPSDHEITNIYIHHLML